MKLHVFHLFHELGWVDGPGFATTRELTKRVLQHVELLLGQYVLDLGLLDEFLRLHRGQHAEVGHFGI